MKEKTFHQGDIWVTRLDPTEGAEINKTRPCLIISGDISNNIIPNITIIPISSGRKHHSLLVLDIPSNTQNNLTQDSSLLIPQIRSISKKRCLKKIGKVNLNFLQRIKKSFEYYFWDDIAS